MIGSPIRHSFSPAMHNAAFRALDLDWAFLAFEVPPGAAADAVVGARALGFEGLSVTMPHKATVIPALDRLSPTAEAVGAVNTIVRRAGDILVGENTDGTGLLAALAADEGFDPAGHRCLVVGAGGAARAVVRALAEAGASEVVVVNRTRSRADAASAVAGNVGRVGTPADAASADLVVNATPVGMPGVNDDQGMAIDDTFLGPGQLVVDLVYLPAITPLVEAARRRGAVATNGLGMLVHQAALAFRLWTAEEPPLAVMSAAALAQLSARATP